MNLKRITLSILVIVILVAAGYWVYRQYLAPQPAEETTAVDVDTIAVETGVDVVSAEGQIVPLRQAELSFLAGGRVAELLAAEGDSVEAGQPLLRLEAAELEAALAQAEAAVTQAEAALQVADIRIQTAEVGVQVAEIGVDAAEAQLALVTADPLPEQIAALESNIAAAEAAIAQAAANRDVALTGATSAQIQAAQAQVAAAAAQERTLQDQYDQIVNAGLGGTPEEQARFALNAAEASLVAAQAALNQLSSGATPAEQQAANAAISVASAQRDAAQAQLDLLQADTRPEQVAVAEAAIAQAEGAVLQAQAAVEELQVARLQAEASIVQAEAGRQAAQAALDRMTLVAPFAGMVAEVTIEPGEAVAPGIPVVMMADMGGWLVETTDLTELDVVAVAVGYPAEVRIDAIPDEVLQGTVTDIATVANPARGDVNYTITIELEETADLPLRWGMTAFVDIDVNGVGD
jgi:multidrug resistance efflux pump